MYSDTVPQSTEFARSAMERMAHEGIPANPENFAVWYEYYCGKNAALVKAIDVLVAGNQKFDEEVSGELYDKHVGSDTGREAVKDVGERIQSQLESVIGVLGEVSEGTGEYGNRLRDASATLGGGDLEMEGLKRIVESLMADTQKVAEQNQQLDAKLKQSSKQMQNLREELEVAPTRGDDRRPDRHSQPQVLRHASASGGDGFHGLEQGPVTAHGGHRFLQEIQR